MIVVRIIVYLIIIASASALVIIDYGFFLDFSFDGFIDYIAAIGISCLSLAACALLTVLGIYISQRYP